MPIKTIDTLLYSVTHKHSIVNLEAPYYDKALNQILEYVSLNLVTISA